MLTNWYTINQQLSEKNRSDCRVTGQFPGGPVAGSRPVYHQKIWCWDRQDIIRDNAKCQQGSGCPAKLSGVWLDYSMSPS